MLEGIFKLQRKKYMHTVLSSFKFMQIKCRKCKEVYGRAWRVAVSAAEPRDPLTPPCTAGHLRCASFQCMLGEPWACQGCLTKLTAKLQDFVWALGTDCPGYHGY